VCKAVISRNKKQNLKGSEIKNGNDFNLCVKYFLINYIWRQNTEALSPAYTEDQIHKLFL